MAETVDQGTKAAQAAADTSGQEARTERTFTQAELDAILGDRLARERAKFADYDALREKAGKYDAQEEAGKTELQKATDKAAKLESELKSLRQEIDTRNAREKVSAATGVPAQLLTGSTEEECKKQAEALKAWRGENSGYPPLRDGGEVSSASPGGKTRDQFAEFFTAALNTKGV